MDYGQIVRRAWEITRRNRFLWVLALFAGSPAASCNGGSWNVPSRGSLNVPDTANADIDAAWANFTAWLGDNLAVVLGIVLAVVAVGLLFTILSLICSGALSRSTADLARGRPSSLGAAWRAGLRLFWRNVRLGLLQAALIIPLVGLAILAVVLAITGSGDAALAILVPLGVLLLLAAIPYGIVIAYARMNVAVLGDHAIPAMRRGWGLFRGNLGTSLLAWLISVVLGIGVGIVLVVGLLVLAIPIGVVLLVAYAASVAALVVAALVVGALLLGVFIVYIAAANTLLSTYWTLIYLRLAGRAGVLASAD